MEFENTHPSLALSLSLARVLLPIIAGCQSQKQKSLADVYVESFMLEDVFHILVALFSVHSYTQYTHHHVSKSERSIAFAKS